MGWRECQEAGGVGGYSGTPVARPARRWEKEKEQFEESLLLYRKDYDVCCCSCETDSIGRSLSPDGLGVVSDGCTY